MSTSVVHLALAYGCDNPRVHVLWSRTRPELLPCAELLRFGAHRVARLKSSTYDLRTQVLSLVYMLSITNRACEADDGLALQALGFHKEAPE